MRCHVKHLMSKEAPAICAKSAADVVIIGITGPGGGGGKK